MIYHTASHLQVAASSALVVGWAPEAIGSGIPEVMAYLNGCMVGADPMSLRACVRWHTSTPMLHRGQCRVTWLSLRRQRYLHK